MRPQGRRGVINMEQIHHGWQANQPTSESRHVSLEPPADTYIVACYSRRVADSMLNERPIVCNSYNRDNQFRQYKKSVDFPGL
jgi:hypothetical protein